MTEPESRREGRPAHRGSPDGDRPVGGHLTEWPIEESYADFANFARRLMDPPPSDYVLRELFDRARLYPAGGYASPNV